MPPKKGRFRVVYVEEGNNIINYDNIQYFAYPIKVTKEEFQKEIEKRLGEQVREIYIQRTREPVKRVKDIAEVELIIATDVPHNKSRLIKIKIRVSSAQALPETIIAIIVIRSHVTKIQIWSLIRR